MPKQHKPILLFQRIVPHYRIPIFHRLFKEMNIIVCHSKERKDSNLKSSYKEIDCPNEFLNRIYFLNKENCVIQNVITPLIKYKPKIVISEFSMCYLSFWLIFFLKHIFHYKLIAYCHGISNKDIFNPLGTIKNKIRFWVYQSLDAIILYSEGRKKIVSRYIEDKSKLFVAKNTLDTSNLLSLHNKFKKRGLNKIRKEIGFKGKYHLIYVGRLLKDKKIELLLSSFEKIQQELNVALHIIGSGPKYKIVNKYSKKIQNLYYHGEIFDTNLVGKYLYASDILVNPGYVGLSVIHSACFETPIITCNTTENGPFHSPEAEIIEHNKNGIFCNLSENSIVKNIRNLLKNKRKLKNMSMNAYKIAINEYSIERMIDGYKQAINYVSTDYNSELLY